MEKMKENAFQQMQTTTICWNRIHVHWDWDKLINEEKQKNSKISNNKNKFQINLKKEKEDQEGGKQQKQWNKDYAKDKNKLFSFCFIRFQLGRMAFELITVIGLYAVTTLVAIAATTFGWIKRPSEKQNLSLCDY